MRHPSLPNESEGASPVGLATIALRERLRSPSDWIVVFLGLHLLAWFGWTVFHWGSPDVQVLISDIGVLPMSLGLSLVAALKAWRAADSRQRVAWSLVAAAFLAFFSGDLIWLFYEQVLLVEPFPSAADVAYVLYYPLMLAGLTMLRDPLRSTNERIMLWLDSGLVLVSGTLLVWHLAIRPALAASDVPLVSALSMVYPVFDLLLLHAAALLVLQSQDRRTVTATSVLGIGLLLAIIADVAFVRMAVDDTYVGGSWPDSMVMTGQFLILLGARFTRADRQPSADERQPAQTARAFQALPYLAMGVAGGQVLWVAHFGPAGALEPLLWSAGTIMLLVSIRQMIVILENRRLLGESVALADQIRAREARFRGLIQNSSDLVTVLDAHADVLYQSPSGSHILGYDADGIVGTAFPDLVHPDDRESFALLLAELIGEAGGVRTVELRLRHRNGAWHHAETVVANLLADPDVSGLVLNTRDVTERWTLEEEMRYQAYADPLTGLASRLLLRERLEQTLLKGPFAVLLLDLDGFKTINDSLGHDAGDQLLIAVASRLRRCVRRTTDTVARLGGDEYGILLKGAREAAARRLAQQISLALQEPVSLNGNEVFVFASIGITTSDRSQPSAEAVLRDADAAMYQAKAAGKGQVTLFEPAMHAAAVLRMELEADLRRAVANDEFVPFFQPKVALEDGHIIGFEALVRWQHPTRGLLSPVNFIGLAEEVGLIADIDRFMLRRAAAFAQRLQEEYPGAGPFSVSSNISTRQLLTTDLLKDVAGVLASYAVDPTRIILEITESALIYDTARTLPLLQALKKLGVRLAIDDFGTGYSSLSYLKDLPVDILKIDKSFITPVDESRQVALVRGIINLARALDLDTVAEGVETAEHEAVLRSLGCRYGQGYYYARPLPEPEALARAGRKGTSELAG